MDIFEFWERIDTSGDCWIWTGAKDRYGYGYIHKNSGLVSGWKNIHRLIYQVMISDIPSGLFVCHRCDNPPCCNPEHLFLGTIQDNNRDRDQKKRTNIAAAVAARVAKQLARTHCSKGHDLTPENTIFGKKDHRHRTCRECRRRYNKSA
jgi:hypothetical protein